MEVLYFVQEQLIFFMPSYIPTFPVSALAEQCEGLLARVTGDGNLLYSGRPDVLNAMSGFNLCKVSIKLIVAFALRRSKSCFCRSVGNNLQVLLEAIWLHSLFPVTNIITGKSLCNIFYSPFKEDQIPVL